MTPGEAEARVGAVVGGKYALTSLLGVGGMGAVYAAENTWTHRPVALKVLHPEFARSREVAERFMQEAQLASQLRHPNIVDVLDLGEDGADGSLYIVQELLQGDDLRAVIDASGRMDVQAALDVALPLMGALALAHRRGVVHRDIKPENVFLARDERGESTPKLIDFGISKATSGGRDDRNLTQAGTLVGTPNYMSPEQARGEANLDGQTDVWSLGVVLYEMLSGKVPFDAPNQNVLMVKIIMEPAARIEAVAPDLPAALADVVHTALASDRGARYPDMASFAAALLRCASPALLERHRRSLPPEIGAVLEAAPWTSPRSVAPPADAAPPRATTTHGTPVGWSQDTPPTPVAAASTPRRGALVGAVAALGLALLAAFAWTSRRPPAPARIVASHPPPAVPAPTPPSPPVAPAVVAPVVEAPDAEAPSAAPIAPPTPAAPQGAHAARPTAHHPRRARPARPAAGALQNGAPILSP